MSQKTQFAAPSDAKPPLFVGIGLQDAHLDLAVVDDSGRMLARLAIPAASDRRSTAADLEHGNLEHMLGQIGDAVAAVVRRAGVEPSAVSRVGVALPGTVDAVSGQWFAPLDSSNRRDGLPICERFGSLCGWPVSFSNDTMAAAYGESWVGAGRNLPSLLLFVLGSRVGCGVVFGDVSIDGKSNYGVDSAHMIIEMAEDAPQCACGQRGHLEAYVSEAAVIRRVQQALDRGRASTLTNRLQQGYTLTTDLIAQEAEANDALSLETVAETARYLGVGIVNVMNTPDPDGVLLGGTMTFGGNARPLGRQFLQWIKEEVARRCFASLINRTVIDFAALGGDAVSLGAAGLARLDSIRNAGGRA